MARIDKPSTGPTARVGNARPRVLRAISLVTLAFALTGQGVLAGVGWCRTDPVVMIDGVVVDIFVSAPLDAPQKVTGPTQVVVTVPVGVEAMLVATDAGFGYGETVTFDESRRLQQTATAIEVKVAVYVPATDGAMPVRVEFAPRIVGILSPVTAEGTANEWVSLRTAV